MGSELEKGRVQFEAGDYAGALAAYDRWLSRPHSATLGARVHTNRAACLLRLRRWAEAHAAAQQALAIRPDLPWARMHASAAEHALGCLAEGREPPAEVATLAQLLSFINPQPRLEDHAAAEQWEVVENKLLVRLRTHPNDANAGALLGHLMLDRGHFLLAERYLEHSLQMEDDAFTRLLLALCACGRGGPGALESYRLALQAFAEEDAPSNARLLLALGEVELARRLVEKQRARVPPVSILDLALGECYLTLHVNGPDTVPDAWQEMLPRSDKLVLNRVRETCSGRWERLPAEGKSRQLAQPLLDGQWGEALGALERELVEVEASALPLGDVRMDSWLQARAALARHDHQRAIELYRQSWDPWRLRRLLRWEALRGHLLSLAVLGTFRPEPLTTDRWRITLWLGMGRAERALEQVGQRTDPLGLHQAIWACLALGRHDEAAERLAVLESSGGPWAVAHPAPLRARLEAVQGTPGWPERLRAAGLPLADTAASLGEAYLEAGAWQEALGAFRALLELDAHPSARRSAALLGVCRALRAGDGPLKEALDACLAEVPDRPWVFRARARLGGPEAERLERLADELEGLYAELAAPGWKAPAGG